MKQRRRSLRRLWGWEQKPPRLQRAPHHPPPSRQPHRVFFFLLTNFKMAASSAARDKERPPTVTTHKTRSDNRLYRDVVSALGWKTCNAVTPPGEIDLWIYGPPYSSALCSDDDFCRVGLRCKVCTCAANRALTACRFPPPPRPCLQPFSATNQLLPGQVASRMPNASVVCDKFNLSKLLSIVSHVLPTFERYTIKTWRIPSQWTEFRKVALGWVRVAQLG